MGTLCELRSEDKYVKKKRESDKIRSNASIHESVVFEEWIEILSDKDVIQGC